MPPNKEQPGNRNVRSKNSVREARAASRPKAFLWVLGLIALIGVVALGYVASQPKSRVAEVNNVADTANAGPAQGYLIGKVDAPVKLLGTGDADRAYSVRGVAISASARAKIEAAGGKIEG